MKMNPWAASAALFLFGGVAAQADTPLPPSQNGYPFFVVPTCGSASFTSGKWVPGTIDVTGTLCTIGGSGGGGGGGGSVYGPDATGATPTRAPIFTGGLDPSGFVRPFLTRADGTEATYQPDTRAVSQTLSSALNSFIDIPVNGQSVVGLRFSGLAASGATITYLSSNDATQTPASPISSFNASTGTTSPTRTTDGETRVPVSGRTTLRLAVTTGGTGSITVSYNVSAVGTIVDVGSPVQIGGTLPAFASTPTFNQGSPAVVANAWPSYLTQSGVVLSASNGLPTTDTNAANTIGAGGAATTKAQSVQGIAGGLAVGVTESAPLLKTTTNALEPATAASGKITVTSTAISASTNTTIAAANTSRIAYSIQCAGTAAVNVSETGATLTSATFGAAGASIQLPTGTTPYFSPPVATRTAITAYTGTAQTCAVTEYNR